MSVVVKVDGTDISQYVVFRTAEFTSLINGSVGNCTFQVYDGAHALLFITGAEITLDVDGTRLWGGFLTRALRTYPLPVVNTITRGPEHAPPYWTLFGADYNLLFTKRIIHDGSSATHVSFSYAAGTYDDTIINDLYDNYLDVSGDGLTTDINRVAIAILDIKGVTSGPGTPKGGMAASAGFTWADAMNSISRNTGAIYYITPDRVFTYCDVDSPDTSYVLTDTPTGVNDVGFREMSFLEDGADMRNDAFIWGAGLGSDSVVFSRSQDATSIADHGRWQVGNWNEGIFKQATANAVAHTYVYGSPSSKRGGKDDKLVFEVIVKDPVFLAGQKTRCISEVFGIDQVLPVRQMRIVFPTPTKPLIKLTLTYEIDEPWSMFDIPRFTLPPFNIRLPSFGGFTPPVIPEPSGGCPCGIFDTFGRVDAADWETSDAGIAWQQVDDSGDFGASPGMAYAVDGTGASLTVTDIGTADGSIDALLPTSTIVVDCIISDYTTDEPLGHLNFDSPGVFSGNYVFFDPANSKFTIAAGSSSDNAFSFDGRPFNLQAKFIPGTGLSAKLWYLGDPDPGYPSSVSISAAGTPAVSFQGALGSNGTTWKISQLQVHDIDGNAIDRCSESRFDNFDDRDTGGGGVGVMDWGGGWYVDTGDDNINAAFAVSDGVATAYTQSAAAPAITHTPATTGDFVMEARVYFKNATSNGNLGFDWAWHLSDDPNDNHLTAFVDRLSGGGGTTAIHLSSRTGGGSAVIEGPLTHALTFSGFGEAIWHRWKWEKVGTTHRMKLWLEGDSEPDWEITQTGLPTFTPSKLKLLMQGRNDTAAHFDWINFDYAGKPCFENCGDGAGTFDDFNRTTTADYAGDDTHNAGTPSNGTMGPWYEQQGIGYPSTRVLCDGAVLDCRYGMDGDDESSSSTIDLIYPPTYGEGPPEQLGSSALALLDAPCEWTMRFWTDRLAGPPINDEGASNASIELWLYAWNIFGYAIHFDLNETGFVSFSDDVTPDGMAGSGFVSASYVWTPSVWYTAKVSHDPITGLVKAKVWPDGFDEPFDWLLEGGLFQIIDPGEGLDWGGLIGIELFIQNSFPATTLTPPRARELMLDDLISIGGCTDVLPDGAQSGTGYLVVTATDSGDHTTYSVNQSYLPGSSDVSVNGVHQTAGTDYSESPADGTITFSTPLVGTETVQVAFSSVGIVPPTTKFSDWSTKPAFGAYPTSGTIFKDGEHDFTIDGKFFDSQSGAGVVSIKLVNCYNFVVQNVDFNACTEPMLFINCHDFEVAWWRTQNIIGPHERDGSNRGNAIQMGDCIKYDIHDFEAIGGDTEDVISNFQSGGRSALEYSRIYNFLIDMTGHTSDSGTGIILGDNQIGSWVEVYNFGMIRPGQVGMAIVGGVGHKVHDGMIFSDDVPHSNVGVGEAFDSPDVEVWNMRVQWKATGGSDNPTYWGSGTHDEHDNDWNAPITADDILGRR